MRIFIYSHDTYGLGHLRRNLVISDSIADSDLDARILIATGSPRAHAFDLPDNTKTFQLPAILKQPDGSYASRNGELSIEEAVKRRSKLLLEKFREFNPNCLLVDHSPLGVENELVPLLQHACNSQRKIIKILGMRDIVDNCEVTARSWGGSGALEAIKTVFDKVLVYGDSSILTTAQELGFESLVDDFGNPKVEHVGYVGRKMSPGPKCNRILVTAGGGGDGHHLLRAFVKFAETCTDSDFGFDVITGPFMSERRFLEVSKSLARLNLDISIQRFNPAVREIMAKAAGVISMAGYNTVSEIMAAGCPALLVPRETPRKEQLIRAQRLSGPCGFHWRRAAELKPADFSEFLAAVADENTLKTRALSLDGGSNFVEAVRRLRDAFRENAAVQWQEGIR